MVGPTDETLPVRETGIRDHCHRAVLNATASGVRSVVDADVAALSAARQAAPLRVEGAERQPFSSPPPRLTVRWDELSEEGRSFLNTPHNRALIEEIFQRNSRYDPATGMVALDREAMRREFDELLGDRFTREQKNQLFDRYLYSFLADLQRQAVSMVQEGTREQDASRVQAGLGVGAGTSLTGAAVGFGSVRDNQERFLTDCCEGMDEAQRQDILRAAMSSGLFDSAVVLSFSVQQGFIERALLEMPMQQAMQQNVFLNDMITRGEQTAQRLRQDWEEARDRRDAEREQLAYARLNGFLGGHAREAVDPLAGSAMEGRYLRAGLDSGVLGLVPVRIAK
jgi:hypothetical protein